MFATSTYSFMVAEDAATSTVVGTVSATDPDEVDTVSYAITAGNAAGKFGIATSTGAITVAGALDHESVLSYSLVVEARDGSEGVATHIGGGHSDRRCGGRSAVPTGLGVPLSNGTFMVSWSGLPPSVVPPVMLHRQALGAKSASRTASGAGGL